jgi:hypothetical protein
MGLAEECRRYVGRRVLIRPFYGYGWSRFDPGAPRLSYEEAAGPAPFHARLSELFEYDGELRGGIAIIDEPGHLYHGFHTVFSTRHVGEFDFTARLGHYNVEIGPSIHVTAWPHAAGSPALMGFAEIRDDDAA